MKIRDAAASKARRHGVEADTLEMAMGDPIDNILMAQKQTGASGGASPFGSVSSEVLEKAECTCMSVKQACSNACGPCRTGVTS